VSAWVAAVHARGLLAALAGSLGSGDLRALATCEADIVGVRGAACEGGRTGRISTRRVAELSALARGATLRRHGALVHDGA
jgi:uncharacterized protein (UPF0264 family)